jgi:hypothetical protein
LIYSEKKDTFNNPMAVASTDNIQLQINKQTFDDDELFSVKGIQ